MILLIAGDAGLWRALRLRAARLSAACARLSAACVAARPRLRWLERAGGHRWLRSLLAITVAPFFVAATHAGDITPQSAVLLPDVLAKDPATYAILELPIFPSKRGQYGGTYQAFQIVHGKYRFGASISRDHDNVSPFLLHAMRRSSAISSGCRSLRWSSNTGPRSDLISSRRRSIVTSASPFFSPTRCPPYRCCTATRSLIPAKETEALRRQHSTRRSDSVHPVLGADARPVFQDSVTEMPATRMPSAAAGQRGEAGCRLATRRRWG